MAERSRSGEAIRRVRAEQVAIVYKRLPAVLAMNVLVASVLVLGLWRVEPATELLIWAAIMSVVVGVRAVLCWRYAAVAGTASDPWAGYLVIGAGASGLLWGAVAVFLFPAEPLEYQLFVWFILMGMGAGAVAALTAYMPAFYAYLPVAMLPILVRFVQAGDTIHLALAAMVVAYVAGLLFFGRSVNRTLVDSLFENFDLVQALSLQKAQAEQANVAKSKFLAAASHDLRQPLHALMLFSSALDEQAETAPLRAIAGNIRTSLEAMDELFSALLDISRLDAEVLHPECRHFKLEVLAERLRNDFGAAAEARGLALLVADCNVMVYSDPTLLERILRNFVSNAIRYTESGEVRIACRADRGRVRISVTDTGIGIPAAQHAEIFREFHQLANPERDRAKGLGLGLAIVERIARLLEHELALESEPGRGSSFSITVEQGDADRLADSERPWVDALLGELVGLRTLVIDDEITVREGMRTLLELWDCEVTVVGDEDEAVAALRPAAPPEVVIADYRLRDGRTGVQAIERLRRELGHDITALIITGDTAAERLREVKASGYQLAHKPVKPAMLRAFLHNARKQQGESRSAEPRPR